MAQATMVLHKGAQLVEYRDLPTTAPEPTRTWFPVAHRQVLDTALGTLDASGYQISRMQLALTPDQHRFFGLCPARHKPNCAGFGIMRRSVDSTAGTRLRRALKVGIIPYASPARFSEVGSIGARNSA